MARLCRLMRAPVLVPMLVGLAALFTIGACTTVETDVADSVRSALDVAGMEEVTVDDVAYRNVTLAGPHMLETDALSVAGALAATQDVRFVGTGGEPESAPPAPTEVTAAAIDVNAGNIDVTGTVDGGRMILQGVVPDEATRALLVAAAESAFGEQNTTYDLMVGGVVAAPEVTAAATELANVIDLLPERLASGRLALDNSTLAVRGEAATVASARSLRSSIESLTGIEGRADILAPRVAATDFSAVLTATGISLTGVVPDEAARTQLVAAAEAAFGGAGVVDELTVEGVAATAEQMEAIAEAADLIGLLPGALESGDLRLRDATLGIRGTASSLDGLANLTVAAEGADAARARTDIDAGQAATRAIEQVLARDTITFASGSAELTENGSATLDRVADVLTRAMSVDRQVRIEIAGHTDDRGDEAANLALSQARAETVWDYLAGQGVAAARLLPVGYGEAQPVAENTTAAGRAQNRRIEFLEG